MASTPKQQAKHFWSEHLEQWQSSGLSQAAYCRKHDLCQQKFSYRKRQADISCVGNPERPVGFARVEVDPLVSSSSGAGLSLRFNEGVCIEGITVDNLLLVQPLLSLLR